MKMDIELKGLMNDVSDPNLYDKIFNIYAEAKDEVTDFQMSHLAFLAGDGLNPDNIKKGGKIQNYTSICKLIDATGGDIKKLAAYDIIIGALRNTKLVVEATSKKSKYLDSAFKLHDLIVDNKESFAKHYKNPKLFSIIGIVYRTAAIALITEAFILSVATLASQGDSKTTVDKYIEGTKGWKELFDRIDEMVLDKDVVTLIKASNVELKAEAIDEYRASIANNLNMYSEMSLQDIAFIFKLGLAKVMYRLFGIIRFIIYICLVSKYTVEARLQEMKNIMTYSQQDLNSRINEEDKLMDNLVEIRIDDIRTFSDAEKSVTSVKVKEMEEGKLSL